MIALKRLATILLFVLLVYFALSFITSFLWPLLRSITDLAIGISNLILRSLPVT